jgi:hypothetical protein
VEPAGAGEPLTLAEPDGAWAPLTLDELEGAEEAELLMLEEPESDGANVALWPPGG